MYAATAEGGDSERTCARIWRLTLDRVNATPLAGDLLRLLAWYAPDRIPRNLLAPLATPPEVDVAIGKLAAYNMITDNHDGTLTVHRLVQALAAPPTPTTPTGRLTTSIRPGTAPPNSLPRHIPPTLTTPRTGLTTRRSSLTPTLSSVTTPSTTTPLTPPASSTTPPPTGRAKAQ